MVVGSSPVAVTITKVIRSLENGGILIRETTRKITSQEGGFFNVLLPFGLSAGMAGIDTAIQKKIFGSGTLALIISNKEMEYIMKILKSLEESGLIIKAINEIIKKEAKEQKVRFLSILLAASLLGSALSGREVIRVGGGTIRAS